MVTAMKYNERIISREYFLCEHYDLSLTSLLKELKNRKINMES